MYNLVLKIIIAIIVGVIRFCLSVHVMEQNVADGFAHMLVKTLIKVRNWYKKTGLTEAQWKFLMEQEMEFYSIHNGLQNLRDGEGKKPRIKFGHDSKVDVQIINRYTARYISAQEFEREVEIYTKLVILNKFLRKIRKERGNRERKIIAMLIDVEENLNIWYIIEQIILMLIKNDTTSQVKEMIDGKMNPKQQKESLRLYKMAMEIIRTIVESKDERETMKIMHFRESKLDLVYMVIDTKVATLTQISNIKKKISILFSAHKIITGQTILIMNNYKFNRIETDNRRQSALLLLNLYGNGWNTIDSDKFATEVISIKMKEKNQFEFKVKTSELMERSRLTMKNVLGYTPNFVTYWAKMIRPNIIGKTNYHRPWRVQAPKFEVRKYDRKWLRQTKEKDEIDIQNDIRNTLIKLTVYLNNYINGADGRNNKTKN